MKRLALFFTTLLVVLIAWTAAGKIPAIFALNCSPGQQECPGRNMCTAGNCNTGGSYCATSCSPDQCNPDRGDSDCEQTCSDGWVYCVVGNYCANVRVDEQNCGLCGKRCQSGSTCRNGRCERDDDGGGDNPTPTTPPGAGPAPTATPTPTPTPPPSSCNRNCGLRYWRLGACPAGLSCTNWWAGVCRLTACPSDPNCQNTCITPPPTPTPTTLPATPTATLTPRPTCSVPPNVCVPPATYCGSYLISGRDCPGGGWCCRPTPIPTLVGYHPFCPI